MSSNEGVVNELRSRFFAAIQDSSNPDLLHPKDIARVKTADRWLERFWEHNEMFSKEDERLTNSFKMLWETCEWRKQNGVNDINDETISVSYIAEGVFFVHGEDINGCPLFIWRGKKHKKGQTDPEIVRRSCIYWLERLERTKPHTQATMVFDMEGAGLSNLDMDLVKFLIGLFKQYYPNMLNFILIFEMPWVLNAAFKVIKSWLPAKAVEKIKFTTKSTISDYVPPELALRSWGGLDDYVYSFVPMDLTSIDETSVNKRVHFDVSSSSLDSPLVRSEDCVKVTPNDSLIFEGKSGECLRTTFQIKNISLTSVFFKVKTTSPEKFRVRPSNGYLLPNDEATVYIKIQVDFQVSPSKDKFLVQAIKIDKLHLTDAELIELWKNPTSPIEQHRLACHTVETHKQITWQDSILKNGSVTHSTKTTDDASQTKLINLVQSLKKEQAVMRNQLRRTQFFQLFSIFLMLVMCGFCFYLPNTVKDVICYGSSEQ